MSAPAELGFSLKGGRKGVGLYLGAGEAGSKEGDAIGVAPSPPRVLSFLRRHGLHCSPSAAAVP
jgi:hypothetical protein